MTTNQAQALWELCRQGFPLAADEAAERWNLGLTFELQQRARLARSVQFLLDQCNWEARQAKQAA